IFKYYDNCLTLFTHLFIIIFIDIFKCLFIIVYIGLLKSICAYVNIDIIIGGVLMSNNQDPIIVTVNQEKGGVGKSFIAFNFSNYLAVEHNKKVLVIDTDFQCNISEIFSIYDQENTFANILTGKGDVKVHSVRPNIDLI